MDRVCPLHRSFPHFSTLLIAPSLQVFHLREGHSLWTEVVPPLPLSLLPLQLEFEFLARSSNAAEPLAEGEVNSPIKG
jgi:hypothetical protein